MMVVGLVNVPLMASILASFCFPVVYYFVSNY